MSKTLFLGMSGLVLPYKNRQAYPAELEGRSRISVYGTIFNTIEINSIFYQLPQAKTVTQWSQQVDNDKFRFTFKLWKAISHSQFLNFREEDLARYFQAINSAGAKRGCILVQFPASVKNVLISKVALLLEKIRELNTGQKWSVAVEFRHHSWYNDQTYELLNAYETALVYHDKKGSESPMPLMNADFIYLRFHGPGGDYKGSYDRGFLYEYAGYIREWMIAEKEVYVYFNNTMGNAIENARALEKIFYDEGVVD